MKAEELNKAEKDLKNQLKDLTKEINGTKRKILERYPKTVKIERKHLKQLLYQKHKLLKQLNASVVQLKNLKKFKANALRKSKPPV